MALFDRTYELVQRSFPVSEYRDRQTLLAMLDWPTYALYVEHDADGAVAGLICCLLYTSSDHFASIIVSRGIHIVVEIGQIQNVPGYDSSRICLHQITNFLFDVNP